ncbi:hypothetical protein M404DRAFT_29442 [Pisolithus tinctorius Marx 270]|uniref:Uncharacterized protein n=1 Tax=Pisolithus tinctorius Marx 270 TaxID=870435 RepID=A0A0C3NZH4_PISTI|nr:hypothetical protein M404DRAFT_29442 [Pisolithus tinctorius Marx 270]
MSNSRPIVTANNNNKGQVIIDWAQVPDDNIRYDTDDEEEVMRVKAKERKRQKVAEQAWQEEQAWLEAKRAEREKAEAKRAAWEAKEERACKEEEKCRAEEEKEAKQKCKAKAGAGGSETGEVKKVVMDPGCTCCAWAKTSKGKCCWPRDGKDTEASPKAIGRSDKGKKRKINKENAEAGPSKQKQVKMSARLTKVLNLDEPKASRSGQREASTERYSGLEDKLEHLIDVTGLIANNLASLFELHETVVKNLGWIANALESLLDKSYGYGMSVTPPDSDSSEFNSDELHKEAKWLKTHSKDKEEESRGEDETMAEAK